MPRSPATNPPLAQQSQRLFALANQPSDLAARVAVPRRITCIWHFFSLTLVAAESGSANPTVRRLVLNGARRRTRTDNTSDPRCRIRKYVL